MTPANLEYRLISMPDGLEHGFAALHTACFTHKPWSADFIRSLMDGPGVAAVTACASGWHPLAFLLYRVVVDEAEILTFCVHPQLRRQGVGTELLTRFMAQAEHAGGRSAYLEVAVDNAAALALYTAAGFVRAGLRKEYYGDGQGGRKDAAVMRREFMHKP